MGILLKRQFERAKPFLAVVFLQFGFAGMDVLSKVALNKGMSNYVFVVYRHAIAFVIITPFAVILDKKARPKMTISIFTKIVALSILEPVIDQNLYFLGMKYTTATFASAMSNMVPAITFVMAWILRLEKIKLRSIRSLAKVAGTVATVAGAMVMTLMKGPVLEIFGAHGTNNHNQRSVGSNLQHAIKGSVMITTGCFCWSCFMILQAITLETYPAELSLTAWICLLGTVEGAAVGLVMERRNPSVWSLHWDTKLLAAVYSVRLYNQAYENTRKTHHHAFITFKVSHTPPPCAQRKILTRKDIITASCADCKISCHSTPKRKFPLGKAKKPSPALTVEVQVN